ncbi:hypothetical protein [Streptomyces flavidovirens]|uniref:hypothetical protein n=1 Tax=Streptomyces flavidovirens TaxID=67298 RepID=UPI0036CD6EF8
MTVRSGWLLNRDAQGGGQTREDTRVVPTGTFFPTGEMTVRAGCVPGGDPFKLTSSGAMEATMGVGRAIIQGTAAQGAYPVAVTEPEVLVFADGDPQFPRKDTVALRVQDSTYDGTGQVRAYVEIMKGTPAASPVAPTATGTAEKLYEITVPAGASAGTGGIDWATAVADRRRNTTGVGGIMAGGWTASYNGSYAGQYRDNAGVLERWSGTTWEPVLRLGNSGRVEFGDLTVKRGTDGSLHVEQGVFAQRATPTDYVFSGKAVGDTYDRLRLYADGSMYMGAGTTPRDVNLYRGGANILKTDDYFECAMSRITSGVTATSGWTVFQQDLRVRAGVTTVHLAFTRSSATSVTAPASGNITPDLLLSTVPAAWRPPYDMFVAASTGVGDGSVRIDTAGNVELLSWTPSQSIAQSATLRVEYTFIK